LNNAEFEKFPEPVEVVYKSGASYTGMVSNHLKCGQGIFRWPNGARYEGQYSDNARNGKGMYLKAVDQSSGTVYSAYICKITDILLKGQVL
jgi:hypothetical protein